MKEVVIVATKRTPIGQFMGELTALPATALGSIAIKGALNEVQIRPEEIDEVIMGCVLPAGLGQAPARQAAMGAGLPPSVGAVTVNKVCGSGMKAIMIAHDEIVAGSANIIIAGGMESMTNAPHLLPKARLGYRLGHTHVYDHMFLDGLEDAYDKGKLMGAFAENCATQFGLTRQEQDNFTLESLKRAQNAIAKGWFDAEIVPVEYELKGKKYKIVHDELPGRALPEKIPQLKPAFKEDGTITAANSSAISDGASAHILMSAAEAKKRNIKPLAKIIAHATFSQEPSLFTTAPIEAIKRVIEKAHWRLDEVDLFEINEAFAVVALAAIKALNLSPEKVNIHGGACALGHPIGASGARLLTTLIYALKQNNLTKGVAALCLGGGEATAVAVEIVE